MIGTQSGRPASSLRLGCSKTPAIHDFATVWMSKTSYTSSIPNTDLISVNKPGIVKLVWLKSLVKQNISKNSIISLTINNQKLQGNRRARSIKVKLKHEIKN